MIKIVNTTIDNPLKALASRTIHRDDETERIVKAIIDDVRQRGDQALLENAHKFDAPGLESIVVTEQEIVNVEIDPNLKQTIELAYARIEEFHFCQLRSFTGSMSHPSEVKIDEDGEVVTVIPAIGHSQWRLPGFGQDALGQRILPVSSAGVYVPGGRATYVSSVLMNAIPAHCAGVRDIFVTTPTRPDGSLDPAILFALRAGLLDLKAFKIGGAAAIAALALGTESVPRVDKIVGPGNRFVNEAKRQLWGVVGLDGYAGPSEVCVLADETTNAKFAAIDFLTQIEHAPDNCGFLVCTDEAKFNEILGEIDKQVTGEEREETMRKAMAGDSIAFLAKDLDEACDIVNAIAPEHLSIATKEPEKTMEKIQNAGCILLGEWSPESAGDFVAGPSHTLPTSGAARFQSPVNVLDFLKVQSVIRMSKDELKALTPAIETFGKMEGFPLHGRGATIRFEE